MTSEDELREEIHEDAVRKYGSDNQEKRLENLQKEFEAVEAEDRELREENSSLKKQNRELDEEISHEEKGREAWEKTKGFTKGAWEDTKYAGKKAFKSIGDVSHHRGKYEGLMAFVLIVHLYDFLVLDLAINTATFMIRLVLYIFIGFLAKWVLEDHWTIALREYTVVSAIPILLAPSLDRVVAYFGAIDAASTMSAVILAVPVWAVYLFMRGIDYDLTLVTHGSTSLFTRTVTRLTSAIKLTKIWFFILFFTAIINGLALSAPDINFAIQGIQTPGIDTSAGIQALGNILMGAAGGVQSAFGALVDPIKDFRNETIGNSYQGQVERNIQGIDPGIEPLTSGLQVIQEGSEFRYTASVQLNSDFVSGTVNVSCEANPQTGEPIRATTEPAPFELGGPYGASQTVTCIFDDLEPGLYEVEMEATYPFKTQAYTRFFFADFEYATSNSEAYRSDVRALNADEADAQYTAGPLEILTSSDTVNPEMPIRVSTEAPATFPYGFVVKERGGEITSFQNLELHVPEFFTLRDTSPCTVDYAVEQSGENLAANYYKILLTTDFLTEQGDQKFALCNFQITPENRDQVIFEDDMINPVTLSTIAEYRFTVDEDIRLRVEENIVDELPTTGTEVNQTGNNT